MKQEWLSKVKPSVALFLIGCAGLALVSSLSVVLALDLATTAFAYLIVIVLVSLKGRFLVVALLSILSVAILLAEPIFQFRVDLTQDFVMLAAFLLTSLIVTGLVGRARQQTEAALQAETKAREAERTLRLSVDTIPALVWSALPDGSLDFLNQRWEEIGLSLEDLRGSKWTGVLHPDERARAVDKWRTAVETGTPYENIERLRTGDGTYRWVLSRARPLRNELGKIIKWYGTDTDIEDRIRAEEVLREQAGLLDLTHDTIFVRDMHNVITYWNRGAEELYGWTAEEVIGKVTTHQLLRTVFPGLVDTINEELLRTDRWEGELVHSKADGTQVVVASRWSLERDQGGLPVAILETNNDITNRKHTEEALRRARADLVHAARVTTLGELTASIAHEVNQPLAGVVSSGDACLRWLSSQPPNIESARQSVSRIIRDANRASDVVGRIRSLAKKDPLQKVWLSVNETVAETIGLTRMEVAQHRASLKPQLSDDIPLVWADRVQLQQVILNLIINALEAVSAVSDGPRELVVATAKHESDGLLLTVRDSGSGLDPQNIERIFDAFYTTKREGMGMGLSVSRSIIEAHGGRLWATPNEPRGAVFQFTLPVGRDEAA